MIWHQVFPTVNVSVVINLEINLVEDWDFFFYLKDPIHYILIMANTTVNAQDLRDAAFKFFLLIGFTIPHLISIFDSKFKARVSQE